MSERRRAGGLTELFREAESESWSRRAAAGRQLAASADREEVVPVLERLLSDPHDTAVTQLTAQALLQRRDLVGLRTVLGVLSRAEEWWTADELDSAVFGHQGQMITDGRSDQFVHQLEALASDDDPGIRGEALRFLGRGPETVASPDERSS